MTSKLSRRQFLRSAGGVTFLALSPVGRGLFAFADARAAVPLFTALPYVQPGPDGRLTPGREVVRLAWQTEKTPEVIPGKWDRHQGGANCTFFDGHAKWLRFEQTLDPNNFQWGETWHPAPFQNSPLGAPCK